MTQTIAVTGGRVVPIEGDPVDGGTILVRDGKIAAVEGPGYAAADLAEIVGPTGEVVALERSQNFIRAMETTCRARSLANVRIHELDLMKDEFPKGDYDFAWCRWVVS